MVTIRPGFCFRSCLTTADQAGVAALLSLLVDDELDESDFELLDESDFELSDFELSDDELDDELSDDEDVDVSEDDPGRESVR